MAKRLRYGAIKLDGSVAIPIEHEALGTPSCGRVPFLKDGKWGFLDYAGDVRVEPQYDFVWSFQGDAAAVERGGTWTSIGLDGDPVEGFRGPWSEERASTTVEGQPSRESLVIHQAPTGYVNTDGELVIELKFTRARAFNHGLATVQRIESGAHGKFEALDRDGNTMVGPIEGWDAFDFQSDGLCRFKAGTMMFYDKSGKLVLDAKHAQVRDFADDLAAYEITKKGPGYDIRHWGFLDREGGVAIEPAYDAVSDFRDGYATCKVSGKHGVIDREGTLLLSGLREIRHVVDGVAPAALQHPQHFSSNAWGLVNVAGEWLLPAENVVVSRIMESRLIFKREDGRIGILDTSGRIVADDFVSAKFRDEWPFPMTRSGRRTKTGKLSGAKWGLYDGDGNVVVEEQYADMIVPSDGLAIVANKV